MFFNTEMLTKRGPLAKVWLASHVSSKLTKSTLLSTSISSSVEAILGPAFIQTIALRLSGQLLLGVTRIYSRKTKYLLEDCNETLAKVKKAFRPGQVDLEDGGLNVAGESRNKEAVTLRAENGGLEDILAGFDDWDNDLAPLNNNAVAGNSKSKSKNIAKLADITLADHSLDFGLYNDDNQNDGAYGFDFGPEGALGDEYELDLGFEDELDLGFGVEGETSAKGKGKKRARDNGDGLSEVEGEDDEDRSVEAGRDAAGSQAHASARGSSLPPRIDEDGDMIMGEKDEEMGAFDDMGMDFGDYGGGGKEDQFDLEGQREKTPQTNADLTESYGLTPKTAADLIATKTAKAAKKANLRKQVVDKSTQLDITKINKENLFVEPQFLPSSRLHLLLQQNSESTVPSPYLPIVVPSGNKSASNWFIAAPLGLASELTEMFKFPTRKSIIEAEKKVAKALRLANGEPEIEEEIVDEVELGRRAAREMSLGGDYMDDNYGGGGKEDQEGTEDQGGYGYDPMGDENYFQFDLGEGEDQVVKEAKESSAIDKKKNKKQKLDHDDSEAANSRYAISGILEDEVRTLSLGPLAIFDSPNALPSNNQSTQQTGTQAQSMGETEEDALVGGVKGEGEGNWKAGKWSKNTVKALEVLKNELGTDEHEEVVEVKQMEFETVAKQATRRAAAAFFFELLVLGTRDCIKVEQTNAYGSITVMAKEKLFEVAQSQVV